MSDINTGTPLQDVDKAIIEALKAWEECGFKDMSLWETFQEDFEGFTEEDFKSASNYNIRRLRDCLRKFGVWIRKQQRFTIARSLYEALIEEEPTPWTEADIMACLDKEELLHIISIVCLSATLAGSLENLVFLHQPLHPALHQQPFHLHLPPHQPKPQ